MSSTDAKTEETRQLDEAFSYLGMALAKLTSAEMGLLREDEEAVVTIRRDVQWNRAQLAQLIATRLKREWAQDDVQAD